MLDDAMFYGWLHLFPTSLFTRGEKTIGCCRNRTWVSKREDALSITPWPLGHRQGYNSSTLRPRVRCDRASWNIRDITFWLPPSSGWCPPGSCSYHWWARTRPWRWSRACCPGRTRRRWPVGAGPGLLRACHRSSSGARWRQERDDSRTHCRGLKLKHLNSQCSNFYASAASDIAVIIFNLLRLMMSAYA